MEWQLISTAPKDGTHIWAVLDYKDRGKKEMHAIYWSADKILGFPWVFCWGDHGGCGESIPTSWIPLPALPNVVSFPPIEGE